MAVISGNTEALSAADRHNPAPYANGYSFSLFAWCDYVSRKFKQEYGINFSDYIGSVRINKAKLLLQNPNLKLSQISEMVGFHDVKYFSKVFKKQIGVTPKDYRVQVTP